MFLSVLLISDAIDGKMVLQKKNHILKLQMDKNDAL
jgi:hypothetical protein